MKQEQAWVPTWNPGLFAHRKDFIGRRGKHHLSVQMLHAARGEYLS
jgi:hypothetical protein